MTSSPSAFSSLEDESRNNKIHAKLARHIDEFSEPTEANVDIILALVASCDGSYSAADMSRIWRALKPTASKNAQFIAELKKETVSGRKQYGHILSQFNSSVPTMPQEKAAVVISSFLDEIDGGLRSFIQSEDPLPLWKPPESPHAEFLRSLRIPAGINDGPDMLLHELGSFKTDRRLNERLNNIFCRNAQLTNMVLINTSGSGKTRLSLEGLCKHWGFYFTCSVDGHGSTDLATTIEVRIGGDPCFDPKLDLHSPRRQSIHENNRVLVKARIEEMLLARLIIFSAFCRIVGNNPTDAHKRLWVILQIRPRKAGKWDIFEALTSKIKGIDPTYRANQIEDIITTLYHQLASSSNSPPFFCVVDEAQDAASGPRSFPEAFMSHEEFVLLYRPILREVSCCLIIRRLPLALNLTGTGMDKTLFQEIFSSGVLKERPTTYITDIGAFVEEEEHRRYMQRRMPPIFSVSTPEVTALFERCFLWLKGRYRFTATFIQELLHQNFENPHRVLNSYVMRSTQIPVGDDLSDGFRPTDGRRFWKTEPRAVDRYSTFGFGRFEKLKSADPVVLNAVRKNAMKYWMRSEPARFLIPREQRELVVAGFARYSAVGTDNTRVLIDEPLALLALIEWLRIRDIPFSAELADKAAAGFTDAKGTNGLEEYLAFYFSAVFDDHTPLNEIFHFAPVQTPVWAEKPASLVSLYRLDNTLEEGRVEENARPSVALGGEDVFTWLEHRDRAPFCFPDKAMGPDILFVLKLRDANESLLWVAVQSKFYSGEGIFPAPLLRAAVESLSPPKFYAVSWKYFCLVAVLFTRILDRKGIKREDGPGSESSIRARGKECCVKEASSRNRRGEAGGVAHEGFEIV
ncbi:hypothetical protein C8R43DRAFT_317228 [Mycena crocata]|nr:hypothetical protein C8R43DRAFT_317228 [Mycena crocata]